MSLAALLVAFTLQATPQGHAMKLDVKPSARLLQGTSEGFAAPVTATPVSFNDKLLHMSICANLAYGSATLARAFGFSQRWSLVIGAATAMGAGLLKEWMDLNGAGHAEWGDLGADVIGTAAGLSVTLLTGKF